MKRTSVWRFLSTTDTSLTLSRVSEDSLSVLKPSMVVMGRDGRPVQRTRRRFSIREASKQIKSWVTFLHLSPRIIAFSKTKNSLAAAAENIVKQYVHTINAFEKAMKPLRQLIQQNSMLVSDWILMLAFFARTASGRGRGPGPGPDWPQGRDPPPWSEQSREPTQLPLTPPYSRRGDTRTIIQSYFLAIFN